MGKSKKQNISTRRRVVTAAITFLLCALVLFLSAMGSLKTAHVQDSIANIPLDIRPNTDGQILIDFGAAGDIDLNLKNTVSGPIGVTITVTGVNPDSTFDSFINGDLSALTDGKIGEITNYFTEESDRITQKLIENIVLRFAIYGISGLLLVFILLIGFRWITWTKRRAKLAIAFTLMLCLVFSGMTAGLIAIERPDEDAMAAQTPEFLIDTSLGSLTFEGAISKPAKLINNVVNDTNSRGWEFSDKARKAVSKALADKKYRQNSSEEFLIHVSDIHDNLYMYPVIGAIAKATKATTVLDTGDVTKTGSSIEGNYVHQYVSTLQKYGVKHIYYVCGNHDTKTTDNQMKKAGATVLDGILVTESGLVIAGYGDPLHTALASSIHTDSRTDRIKSQSKLIEKELSSYEEKNDKRVDILMTHAPSVAKSARKKGLSQIQLAGHNHKVAPEITLGETTLIEANNANGETKTGQNELFGTGIGPIRQDVTIVVLIRDKKTDEFSYFTVKITPKGKAKASKIKPLSLRA